MLASDNKEDSSQEVTCSENMSESSQEVTSSTTAETRVTTLKSPPDTEDTPVEKPVIKVKSFAIVPNDDSMAAKQLEEKTGTFLVLKEDASTKDFPIWKIDGKSLLQKYITYDEDGEVLYRSTTEYGGWSLDKRHDYYPVTVAFKRQDKKGHVVQLDKIRGLSK